MKRFAIYTPYLDSFGGGERYALTVAEVLSEVGQVDLLIDKHLATLDPEALLKKAEKYFNLDLSKVNLKAGPVGPGSGAIRRALFLRKYDLMFYLTDGSIFFSTAKKSVLHLQSPIKCIYRKSEWGRKKLRSWNLIVFNSKFTRNTAEADWGRPSVVIYPPVDTSEIKPLDKEKIILNVGRLTPFKQDKKQELLIEEFLKISKKAKGWHLVLAGSAFKEDEEFIEKLKAKEKGQPVSIMPNLSYEKLLELFGHSSIYWHAKGFQVDDPTLMGHFGITTVEAMAAGAVPVVINRGGQVEIVRDNDAGLLWNGLEELENMTLDLIKDEKLRKELSKKAIEASKLYSKDVFKEAILKLVT